jgi:hypothetical protein
MFGCIALAVMSPVHGNLVKAVPGARIPKFTGRMMLVVIAQGHQRQNLIEVTPALKKPRAVNRTATSTRSRRVWAS